MEWITWNRASYVIEVVGNWVAVVASIVAALSVSKACGRDSQQDDGDLSENVDRDVGA